MPRIPPLEREETTQTRCYIWLRTRRGSSPGHSSLSLAHVHHGRRLRAPVIEVARDRHSGRGRVTEFHMHSVSTVAVAVPVCFLISLFHRFTHVPVRYSLMPQNR